ncbi:MAG: S8 family serine peptidase, partial [Bdellovibrionales bacterium]|nr:S8 family serine peptidase [Bdellovibrionales bacterium]
MGTGLKMFRFLILSIAFVLNACGGQDLAQVAMRSQALRAPVEEQCRAPLSSKLVPPDRPAFHSGKLVLNGHDDAVAAQTFGKVKNASVLRKGHQLVAVIQRHCDSNDGGELYKELLARGRASGHDRGLSPEISVAFSLPSDRLFSDLADQVASESCIVGISERLTLKSQAAPNDARFPEQKHHAAIGTATAWDTFFHKDAGINKTVVVAIIDTGISMGHEDLKGQLWANSAEVSGNGVDDDRNGYVDDVNGYNFADNLGSPEHRGNWSGNDHGSHVAGLTAAQSGNSKGGAGIMGQNVRIMPLNVFGAVAGAETENIDAAIRYAADMGAHVINMSLGGPGRSDSTLSALQYAASKGVVIAVAAGNDNTNIEGTFFSPAGYARDVPGMLAVASTDAVTKQRSFFSNYSKTMVEIAAPGSNGILSTVPTNQYRNEQGTSMASPVVAGAMSLTYGLIWSRTGSVPTPSTVKSLLMASADKLAALQSTVSDGNHLNLIKLAEKVNGQFPPGQASG